jgi:hypothetical protein
LYAHMNNKTIKERVNCGHEKQGYKYCKNWYNN